MESLVRTAVCYPWVAMFISSVKQSPLFKQCLDLPRGPGKRIDEAEIMEIVAPMRERLFEVVGAMRVVRQRYMDDGAMRRQDEDDCFFDGAVLERLFDVAGAMPPDILPELRAALDTSILGGLGFGRFYKDFNAAVRNSGWEVGKGKHYIAHILFTNCGGFIYALRDYMDSLRPQRFDRDPHWLYQCMNPMCEHTELDRLLIPCGDPWWDMHYPPNGLNCECHVRHFYAFQIERERIEPTERRPTLGFSPEWIYICTGEKPPAV